MFEFFKLAWDFIVLRDQSSKGRLKPRMMVAGLLYAAALYGIGLPAGLLYINHPGNPVDKAILIAAIAVLIALTVLLAVLTIRWNRQLRAQTASQPDPGQQ
jgi:multisubunit Na+/H+ antiporter MnhC subunit